MLHKQFVRNVETADEVLFKIGWQPSYTPFSRNLDMIYMKHKLYVNLWNKKTKMCVTKLTSKTNKKRPLGLAFC